MAQSTRILAAKYRNYALLLATDIDEENQWSIHSVDGLGPAAKKLRYHASKRDRERESKE